MADEIVLCIAAGCPNAGRHAEHFSDYLVEWSIELSAGTPEDAARQALNIIRDRNSMATVFDVIEADGSGEAVRIDLAELDQEAETL